MNTYKYIKDIQYIDNLKMWTKTVMSMTIVLLNVISCNENYYDTLGVARNVDQ